ncbi:translocation/assembly module TamB domain-containing protein [Nguyenibacter vanlangensis]|uniref:translocation/assembly module TamB domain-containing protein n=1 Tax=Nguyenibacter vanlangensis TaxID=1216886 RepID=UPI0038D01C24
MVPPPQMPRRSRHWTRVVAWVAGLIVGIPAALAVIALAVILLLANTGWGRHLIERQTAALTAGSVTLEGISGRFPDALRVRHIALNDPKGTWLAIDGLVLDWRPTYLLARQVRVDRIAMDHLAIPRLPQAATSGPSSSAGQNIGPDLGIDIRTIHVSRIDAGADLAGTAAAFVLDGQARLAHLAAIIKGADVATLPDATIDLALARLDHDGKLNLHTAILPGRLSLHLAAQEGAGGFATAAGLSPLDPLRLTLDMDGPRDANHLAFSLNSGNISSNIDGILDIIHQKAQISMTAHAPRMVVRDGIGWQSVALDAHLSGDVRHPVGQGQLTIDQPLAAGVGANHIAVRFDGHEASGNQAGLARLHAIIDGLSLPGPRPSLLASAPLMFDVVLHPDAAGAPLDVTLTHPLLHLAGQIMTARPAHGMIDLTVPQLAPFAAAGSANVAGHAALHGAFVLPSRPDGEMTIGLDGTVGITGGIAQAVGLIGPDGKVSARIAIRQPHGATGGVVRIDSLTLDGQAAHLSLAGTRTDGVLGGVRDGSQILNATMHLAIDDLRHVLPSLRGQAALNLAVTGPMADFAATGHLDGQVGGTDMPVGPLMADIVAHHLPTAPQGTIMVQGSLDRAPLSLAADMAQDAQGTRTLHLTHLDWKSATGKANFIFSPGKPIPLGTLDLQMTRLADLSRVIGQDLSGSFKASFHTIDPEGTAPPSVAVRLDGTMASARASVRKFTLAGTIMDPQGLPRSDLSARLDGLTTQAASGNAAITVRGPQDALAISATASLQNFLGEPASMMADAVLDVPKQSVALRVFRANAKRENIRLLAPARVAFGNAIGVDRLRITVAPDGVAPAQIDIAGSVRPALALTATIDDLTPAIARPFVPSLEADGTLSVRAALRGTLASPQGTMTLIGRGLKYESDLSGGIPPANLDASAQLSGSRAQLDLTLRAGTMADLTIRGLVPTNTAGTMALQTTGRINLAAANGYLGAQGRQLEGMMQLAISLAGSPTSPRASGTMTLSGGQVHDFAQGVQLSNIRGTITAHDDRMVLDNLTAQAGPGTITVAGSLGAFQPGLPVDLHIVADHARPLASDLVTAEINTDLTVRGQLSSRVDVAGSIVIPHADITIPNALPPSIATLNVIRPGQNPKFQQNAGTGLMIGLDITASSPGQMFVRGHGLDAEMNGRLHVGGTANSPVVSGGFNMRRGSFNLAGISLDFAKGRVAFNGVGVTQAIDPSLDFEADRATNSGTARLLVGGYASAPKISFASTPPLPQDQIMAMLLFGTDAQSLSPTQMAQIAGAVATLTGGSAFDPLSKVRNTLGLDRLQLAGASGVGNGTGTAVEAGKYVVRGVYVGAKQATSGSGTQAQVQVDLTRKLKLNTTVGTGGNVTGFTTPENDPGSSIGLSYQFRY